MIFFERILYKIFIQLFYFLVRIIALFNIKAKKWILGRKNPNNLKFPSRNLEKKLIWMHASSLGEYEQGVIILNKLNKNKKYQTAVSFFSSSGYEVIKSKHYEDFIFYYPLDTKKNALILLKELQPSILLIIKYDYWYVSLETFKKYNLPIYVISAKIKKNFIAFKTYGNWFYSIIKSLDGFFVQDSKSFFLLKKYKIQNCKITGDTRFHRVQEIFKTSINLNFVKEFKFNQNLLVAGSTWKKDDILLTKINLQDIKLIIVPHEINKRYLLKLKKNFYKSILYSEKENKNLREYKVIIVDIVGILSKIYSYADFAFVGGAFDKNGVHNILEPAVFGIPILFGPNIQEYDEAKQLINIQGGSIIKNSDELNFWLNKFLKNKKLKKKFGKNARTMIMKYDKSISEIVNYFSKKLMNYTFII